MMFPAILSANEIELVELQSFRGEFIPGNSYTIVFKVVNNQMNEVALTSILELPEGWNDLAKEQPFRVGPNNSDIRLISVYIPAKAQPGNYRIKYRVSNVNTNDSAQIELPVRIAVVKKLKVSLFNTPSYVLAGDVIKASFVIENQGNSSEWIKLHTYDCRAEADSVFEMAPSSVRTIGVLSETDNEAGSSSYRFLKVNARIQGSDEKADAFSMVSIVQATEQQEDAYFRYPVKLSGGYFGRQNGGDYRFGFQGEISGLSAIDQDGKHLIGFKAIGPNRVNMAITGARYDEYYILYKSPNLLLHLGDNQFYSTMLTEFARYGRGIDVVYRKGKMETGGFLNVPRFYSDIKKEYSAYIGLNPNKKIGIQTRYFAKEVKSLDRTAHLFSVLTLVKPFKQSSFEVEYSFGKIGRATGGGLQLKGSVELKKANFSFMYLKSGKFYSGYYSNASLAMGNLNVHLTPKLNFNLNYHQDAMNPKQDTLLGAAPLSNSFYSGLSYQYCKTGSFAAFAGYQERSDPMASSLFHYKEEFIRVSGMQQFGRFSVSTEGELAKTANILSGTKGTSWNVVSDIGYNKDRNSINAFVNYQNTARYDELSYGQLSYGCRANAIIASKTFIQFNFQSNYSIEEYYRDRSILCLDLKQYIGKNSYFDFTGNYALLQKQVSGKDFSIVLRYTFEVKVPIRKIADFGELNGILKNTGAEKIEGVRLLCNGHTAVTDNQGVFKFRNLKPGKYFLLIDQTSIGLHDIPNIKQPIEIQIMEGQNEFSFGMCRSASITGHVDLKQENMQFYEHSADEDISKENIIIEVSNGEEIVRKYVQLDSDFVFDNLRPGEWNVRVYKNGLSNNYQVETNAYSLVLKSGGTEQVKILVIRKSREVKFLQQSMKISYNAPQKHE